MTDTAVTVLSAIPAAADEVRSLLRHAAELQADRAGDPAAGDPATHGGIRTFAILGDLDVDPSLTENERVVEHDLVGRLVVRLAIDKTLCVGDTRAVRAMYQGAIMEGSWGDEARHEFDVDAAASVVGDEADWSPRPGDVVVIAGPAALADLPTRWGGAPVHDVNPK